MYAKLENGKVKQFISGMKPEGDYISVPDYVAADTNRYDYINGEFIEKAMTMPEKTVEQKLQDLEQLVADLASLQLGV